VLQRRRVARFRHSRLGSRLRRQPVRQFRSGHARPAINGNFAKKNASFYEGYAKVNVTLNDMFAIGANEYYSPNFLNLGAWGNYASVTGKFNRAGAPGSAPPASACIVSGEFGRSGLVLRTPSNGTRRSGRHSRAQLQHLERRRRLHLQGLHSRLPLFRHQPVQGSVHAFTSDYTATTATAASVSAINRVGSSPDGAARPASSSSRLT